MPPSTLHKKNELVRLEAADVEALSSISGTLPLRVGEKILGYARVRGASIPDEFVLTLPGAEPYGVRARKLNGNKSLCLFCHRCKKWRKRLFFGEAAFGEQSLAFENRLECKECVMN